MPDAHSTALALLIGLLAQANVAAAGGITFLAVRLLRSLRRARRAAREVPVTSIEDVLR